MSGTSLRREQYTVGWICALAIETAVARGMLDAEHSPLPRSSNDNNAYVLGSIAKHNVVIACLPSGSYGTTSAAVVATNLLSSFPNVRFGLLVGVGGGVPSEEHDVRLGDVVVSHPDGTFGGVVQIDLGKETVSGFKRTGSLTRTPTVILTALTGLRSKHYLEPSSIVQYIEEMNEKHPKLRKECRYQGKDFDRLFEADHEHIQAKNNNCQKCDPVQEVEREERDSDEPVIHYGMIASGNQVIKNGLVRDALQEEYGIICFEMEAAGLMNDFPCLVIRGICDYSDSHKNKRWQAWAAASAAAYAKELLDNIQPVEVEETQRAAELLPKIADGIADVAFKTSNINRKLDHTALIGHESRIKEWLSPCDPSTNYNQALESRHSNTGAWFIQGEKFASWRATPGSVLWLHGLAGCGKTILSSSIIESLQDSAISGNVPSETKVVLYFYFDFSDTKKQSLDDMLRSLIWQLYFRCRDARQPLESLYVTNSTGRTQPSATKLAAVLADMISSEAQAVLDALDECKEREKLLPWIRHVANLPKLRLILTSREGYDIKDALGKWISAGDVVEVQNDLINKDICVYIQDRVHNTPGFERWAQRKDVQDEIEEKLMLKADGMFRWAACQLDALEHCTDRLLIRKALENLPATLDDTYARTLGAIPVEYKGNTTRILQLLCYSDHPLEMLEVVDALAVELEATPAFDAANRMPRPEEIIVFCSSLVTLNIQTKNVQLAHFSVRQYLFSDKVESPWKENLVDVVAKISLARVCLAYCSSIQQDFDRDEHVAESPKEAIKVTFPFGKYASRNWSLYASVVEDHCENLRARILDFFKTRDQSFKNWMYLCNRGLLEYCPNGRGDLDETEALYWTSHEGLAVSVRTLLDQGVDVNIASETGLNSYALDGAFVSGHENIVAFSLEYGNSYALHAAAASGHEKIVAMLLENGAKVNAPALVYGNTALACAAVHGYKTTVGTLLRHGADTCVWTGGPTGGRTMLHLAILGGDKDIVEMLLDQDLPGSSLSDGIVTAAEYRREEILQLLLRQRFGSNQIPPQEYSLVLERALERGHRGIVGILLDKGTAFGTTTLYRAVYEGHESTVQFLLDHDANIGDKALYTAVIVGHEGIVRTLLGKVANIEVEVFYAATHQANEGSKELLLKPAGDLPLYLMPFQGSSTDFKRILQTLTERAVSDNLLHRASLLGDDSIVRKLLDAGADVHRREAYYGNALQAASVEGHPKIVQILLEAGADVNAEGGVYGNALQAASLRGYDIAWEILEDEPLHNELSNNKLREYELRQHGSSEDEVSEDEISEDDLSEDDLSEDELAKEKQSEDELSEDELPEHELPEDGLLEEELSKDKMPECGDYSQMPPHDYSLLFRDHAKIVAMLLAAGADPNAQGGRYGNALQAALSAGNDWILYQLKGGDPGPLQRGYYAIRDKIVENLVEAGATTTPEADEIVSRLRSSRRFRVQK